MRKKPNTYMAVNEPFITAIYDKDVNNELEYINNNKDNMDLMGNFNTDIAQYETIKIDNKEYSNELTQDDYEQWKNNLFEKIETHDPVKMARKKIGIDENGNPIPTTEDMLIGETEIGWFSQVTSWKRVMNAARRTIGKKPLDKEPSMSWKAKILLAEHSPIRLLEYDWGWNKIRQWVTTHLVRHHEGVEKFVHSQRSDRRELPCDRDHIYQGAKNDMDMTANAQALMSISRKRCCNCASVETRQAWKLVLDELEKKDPILRVKCVPECIYRGFCPEWMSSCGYYKTMSYKKALAEYRNTTYGDDIEYKYNKQYDVVISNTGYVYNNDNNITENTPASELKLMYLIKKKDLMYDYVGVYFEHNNEKVYLNRLIYNTFGNDNREVSPYEHVINIDGNPFNNNINNIQRYNGQQKCNQ